MILQLLIVCTLILITLKVAGVIVIGWLLLLLPLVLYLFLALFLVMAVMIAGILFVRRGD